MNKKIDSLEENGILSIVLLDILWCVHSGSHDLLQRCSNDFADVAVLYNKG